MVQTDNGFAVLVAQLTPTTATADIQAIVLSAGVQLLGGPQRPHHQQAGHRASTPATGGFQVLNGAVLLCGSSLQES